jgi:hypothetical protein
MPKRQPRPLTLTSLEDLRSEVERLSSAERQGTLRAAGNWSLDQCCQHLGRWLEFSLDGFPFKYPWRHRLIGRIVRIISWRWLVSLASRPGFVNPPSARAVEPDETIAAGEGVKGLLHQIARIASGEPMRQPSPVEGAINHDQWLYFHLRHAELHLSFQVVVGGGRSMPNQDGGTFSVPAAGDSGAEDRGGGIQERPS